MYMCCCCCFWATSVVSDSATLQTEAHRAPLSMGFSRQKYWSGLPCSPPGDLPNSGIKLRSPALQANFLPLSYQGSHIYGSHFPIYILKYIYSGMIYIWITLLKLTPETNIINQLYSNKKKSSQMMVQWLRLCTPNARNPGWIPGQGTRSYVL